MDLSHLSSVRKKDKTILNDTPLAFIDVVINNAFIARVFELTAEGTEMQLVRAP
jgi:hypothetical protein